jgi:hypothetical protein
MFLESSRYYNQKTVDIKIQSGKTVKALTIRQLPQITGQPFYVKEGNRLDIISQNKYNVPTKFWHIADANTDLHADNLTATPGRIINVPEK